MTTDRIRHDFRNQLAIIRGYVEMMLAEAPADHPYRPDLQEIDAAAVSALALLASLRAETEAVDGDYPDR